MENDSTGGWTCVEAPQHAAGGKWFGRRFNLRQPSAPVEPFLSVRLWISFHCQAGTVNAALKMHKKHRGHPLVPPMPRWLERPVILAPLILLAPMGSKFGHFLRNFSFCIAERFFKKMFVLLMLSSAPNYENLSFFIVWCRWEHHKQKPVWKESFVVAKREISQEITEFGTHEG